MKKQFVIIYWRDIHGVTSEKGAWQDKTEAIKNSKKYYNFELTTTGEILDENKDFVVIAGTSSPSIEFENVYSDISVIPKSVIIKIKKITK